MLGVHTLQILDPLHLAPLAPVDQTLPEIVALLKQHLSPEPNVILERFKFNLRNRKEGESVADYVAQLRNLARECAYNDKLCWKKILTDRIVCGINDVHMQKKMLAEKALTFEKSLAIALSSEAAAKQTHEISNSSKSSTPAMIHRVDAIKKNNQKRSAICYRCGDARHMANNCLFRDKQCFVCDKVGHITKVCSMKQGSNTASTTE